MSRIFSFGKEPITRRQILDSSKLKEFADDNFRFDENGRKLSKQVENTVGKGEIARYEQFILFPQCFQKACFPGASKGGIVWEWAKTPFCPHDQIMVIMFEVVGNIFGKRKFSLLAFSPFTSLFSEIFSSGLGEGYHKFIVF